MKNKLFVVLLSTLVVGFYGINASDPDLEKLGEGKGNTATYAFRERMKLESVDFEMTRQEMSAFLAKKLVTSSLSSIVINENEKAIDDSESSVSPITVTCTSPIPPVFVKASNGIRILARIDEISDDEETDDISGDYLFNAIRDAKFKKATRITHRLIVNDSFSYEVGKKAKNLLLELYSGKESQYKGLYSFVVVIKDAREVSSKMQNLKEKLKDSEISERRRTKYENELQAMIQQYL